MLEVVGSQMRFEDIHCNLPRHRIYMGTPGETGPGQIITRSETYVLKQKGEILRTDESTPPQNATNATTFPP